MQLEPLSHPFFVKQILDLLVVNFKVRRTHEVLPLGVTSDRLEYVCKCARHDAFFLLILENASDGVRLARACLTICKNCAIVALEHVLTDWECRLRKDRFLLGTAKNVRSSINCLLPIVDRVKSEDFGYIIARLLHKNFARLLDHFYRAKHFVRIQ